MDLLDAPGAAPEAASMPLIGVTGRRRRADTIFPTEATVLSGIATDVFFQPYARGLAAAGANVVFLSRDSAPDVLVQALQGIVLSGGQDVHPDRYGGRITEESTELDPAQDEFDLALARAAIDANVPLLGTCRGHEVLNVALGGTLCDHGRPTHNLRARPAAYRAHPVRFAEDSLLRGLYGPTADVNSLHHQAIDKLGASARATGWAADGIVEAIELPGRPVIGVQWHPEFHAGVDPVFGWLVDAARARSARTPSRSGRGTKESG